MHTNLLVGRWAGQKVLEGLRVPGQHRVATHSVDPRTKALRPLVRQRLICASVMRYRGKSLLRKDTYQTWTRTPFRAAEEC